MFKFKINENGIWDNSTGYGHHFDKSLNDKILNFIKQNNIKNIVDFGCGMGDYVKNFIKEGYSCEAYDGNPHTTKLTDGIAKVLDLSKSFDLVKKYDFVMSLEVGEHIPKKFEGTYIDNLCKHSNKYLLVSWAIIGQNGDGHINCQNNDYIINEFIKRGFKYDSENSYLLRESATNAFWFKNTIMLFLNKNFI
jgi:cyclopropane fatty-acyl-phospholipid synthase-like methyltransferase